MNKILLLLAISMIISCKGKTKNEIIVEVQQVDTVVIEQLHMVFVGDVMTHMPQIYGAAVDTIANSYNFEECFRYVAPHWREADVVIANLETTLDDKNYSGYPRFAAPYSLADALKNSGVTHLMLANNHTCDKGREGIIRTTSHLEKIGVPYAGAYRDSAQWREESPLFIKKGSFNVAVLNYTYGTNGLPVPKGQVVPLIDTLAIKKDIEKAYANKATNIIAFLHWGNEYQRDEDESQRELSEWFNRNGVKIIIGSHPHVVQPIECDSTHLTVYSLGNFISNQRDRYRNGGINIHLNLTKVEDNTTLSTSYKSYYVHKRSKSPRYFCVDSLAADSIITDREEKNRAKIFFDDTRDHLSSNNKLNF
ncbi:MAG: CapA family protein [Rikenellaceae bacterium]